MRPITYVALGGLILVCACQVASSPNAVIVDRGRVIQVRSTSRVPLAILRQAGLELSSGDQVLSRGYVVDPSMRAPTEGPLYLQVRRSAPILLNGKPQQTTASTVAEVLAESGFDLRLSDHVEPSMLSPISAGLLIQHRPSPIITVTVDDRALPVAATKPEVAAALAEAGVPLIGLDRSVPGETELIRQDEGVGISRISENISLVQNPLPFANQAEDSDVLELGIEQVLQPGVPGLAVTRTRMKFQDGVEISRQTEIDVVVRPPQDRLVVRGTKIVERSTTVDGVSLGYWHTMQMYATVYSPCNSATPDGSCSTGTASGRRAGKGVVAVDPGLFAVLNGQRLYIPGYGYAVIGDVGGGYIVEQNLGISRYKWIDLGFDDDNIQDMSGWITVYFLGPAPAVIPEVLK